MARRLASLGQDATPGVEGMSMTMRHASLGGHSSAPKQLESGARYIGGQSIEIDSHLVRKCTESSEDGKIVDVNFHFKFIGGMAGVEKCGADLRTLDLSTNNIRQIEGLHEMYKLRELKLYGCQISRIHGLEKCISLTALHLEDNNISTISGLDNSRALEYLNVDNNNIKWLGRGLSRLTKLKELHISRNRLTTLDGLLGLVALEVVCASRNHLQEVTSEQLKGLQRIDDLQLAGNQISSLSFLAGVSGAMQPVPNLATLDMSSNCLTATSIHGLPAMSQLTELNLAGNQIQDIPESIKDIWPSLEILDLSNNRLERPERLERLKPLTSTLRELLVEGNPFCAQSEDLQRALSALGPLEFVDDRPMVVPKEAGSDGEEESLGDGPSTGAAPSRPGTTAGTTETRPSTGSGSRPSTAQSLKEAGVRDPLMHARLKLTERRFAPMEQVLQWERQTLSSFAAIEKQIAKTLQQSDSELHDMKQYLINADQVLKRESELRARGGYPVSRIEPVREELPEDVAPLSPVQAPFIPATPVERSPPPSRAGRRLRQAVEVAREEEEPPPVEEPAQVSLPASPAKIVEEQLVLPAACDEEIVDFEDAVACGSGMESDDLAEVEEDDIATGASEGEAAPRRKPSKPVELRVEARAGIRRSRKSPAGSRPPRAPASSSASAAGGR